MLRQSILRQDVKIIQFLDSWIADRLISCVDFIVPLHDYNYSQCEANSKCCSIEHFDESKTKPMLHHTFAKNSLLKSLSYSPGICRSSVPTGPMQGNRTPKPFAVARGTRQKITQTRVPAHHKALTQAVWQLQNYYHSILLYNWM